MVPLSPRVADVCQLDNGDGAGQVHLSAAAGDRLFLRPVIPGKWDLPVPDSFRKTLFAKTATHSAGPVTQSALYYDLVCSQLDSFRKLFPQNSFRKTLSANCLKPNQGITGLNSSSSSIKMIRMTLMLLIMSFFLKSITRAWSLLEESTVEICQVMII